ncbi:hypothetical protein [Puia sp.]|jgi:hypothetical protein|uniref:hypothetical protein n=1 Tax=Puia sp. TaxID=2045100 RepID=UPI002F42669E
MKRLLTLSLATVMAISFCSASSSVLPTASATNPAPREIVAPAPMATPGVTAAAPAQLKATEINVPLGNSGKTINLQELSTMKVADLEKMTGKKMGLLNRLEFKLAQKKLRHSINADGTINNKKLAMLAAKDGSGETGFHAGGFFLGLLLGLIGVLIAYLINDEKKHNRVKWAWIGWGVWVVLLIAILI